MLKFPSSCSVLFILLFITACSKQDQQATPDRVTLLTTHQWKLKKLLYRMKGDQTNLDFTSALYHPCELDDIYVFAADSTFARNDNMQVCDAGTGVFGPWGTGTWGANSDLTQIGIKTFYYSVVFTVNELTNTSFILEQATKDNFGNEIVYTYEFVPA